MAGGSDGPVARRTVVPLLFVTTRYVRSGRSVRFWRNGCRAGGHRDCCVFALLAGIESVNVTAGLCS
jgi:hypothetical protein